MERLKNNKVVIFGYLAKLCFLFLAFQVKSNNLVLQIFLVEKHGIALKR